VNGVVFHKGCFKCRACDQQLTLKTYFTNQMDPLDKNIYCQKHTPKTQVHGYDARAIGIQNAMKAQGSASSHGYSELSRGQAPKFGSDAMFINQPVSAQSEYQRRYKARYDQHHFYPAYYHAVSVHVEMM
jgi:hypothetical protein